MHALEQSEAKNDEEDGAGESHEADVAVVGLVGGVVGFLLLDVLELALLDLGVGGGGCFEVLGGHGFFDGIVRWLGGLVEGGDADTNEERKQEAKKQDV